MLRYYVPLFLVAVIVQIFLAGEGVFGLKEGPKLADQKTLDPHRALGFILAEPAALILLILALLAWFPDKKMRWISIGLPFLVFAQDPLAWGGRWSGALHPINAILVLALLAWLTRRLWHRDETVAEPAAAPVS